VQGYGGHADCDFLSWITRVLGQDEDTGSVWDMIC
jgi:hypothetical protein